MFIFKNSYALYAGDKYCIYEFGKFDLLARHLHLFTVRINSYTNNKIAEDYPTNCAKFFRVKPTQSANKENAVNQKRSLVLTEYLCFESDQSVDDIMHLTNALHESEQCHIGAATNESGPCDKDFPEFDFVEVPCMRGIQKIITQKTPTPLKMLEDFDKTKKNKKI